jgi:SAM-dependent methyltransferase
MSLGWMDVSTLSFNSLLLLERVQLSWFPGWLPEKELAAALQANPVVAWYMRHKCPAIETWLNHVLALTPSMQPTSEEIRQAELSVLGSIEDLLVYAVAPERYDAQPFLGWDSDELNSLVDFQAKNVIDVGSGTGRLALVAAPLAHAVYAVEPVENLRRYIREKFRRSGYTNVYPIDGTITELPFPEAFADVTMAGHVFGDLLEQEYEEMQRVTRPGGMVILCPGSSSTQDAAHDFLVFKGFEWSWFEEPKDGMKRKYWKTV